MSPGEEARRFLRARRVGMLATLSRKFDGHPFGSVAPYMLDHEARPIILISTLAEHTRNIDCDSRVSLLVLEGGKDVQAEARATLLGHGARLADQEAPRARYLRYFPHAQGYFDTHDFFFYRIEPVQARFIGGFGDIHWISAESFRPPKNRLAEQEEAIITHMNRDHAHHLRDYCRFYRGKEVSDVEMLGIDCEGFDVRADGEMLRFDFDAPVLDAMQARKVLVDMAMASRQA